MGGRHRGSKGHSPGGCTSKGLRTRPTHRTAPHGHTASRGLGCQGPAPSLLTSVGLLILAPSVIPGSRRDPVLAGLGPSRWSRAQEWVTGAPQLGQGCPGPRSHIPSSWLLRHQAAPPGHCPHPLLTPHPLPRPGEGTQRAQGTQVVSGGVYSSQPGSELRPDWSGAGPL